MDNNERYEIFTDTQEIPSCFGRGEWDETALSDSDLAFVRRERDYFEDSEEEVA